MKTSFLPAGCVIRARTRALWAFVWWSWMYSQGSFCFGSGWLVGSDTHTGPPVSLRIPPASMSLGTEQH